MSADLSLFSKHVEEASFQMAVDQEMWGIADENPHPLTSPSIIIWIRANKLPDGTNKLYLKFDFTNYPASAPTACPWNIESNTRLSNELWPVGNTHVTAVFNPNWNGGNALYTPCDRVAMAGHEPWRTQFPHLWWKSDFKIDVYLNHIHTLLNPIQQ